MHQKTSRKSYQFSPDTGASCASCFIPAGKYIQSRTRSSVSGFEVTQTEVLLFLQEIPGGSDGSAAAAAAG